MKRITIIHAQDTGYSGLAALLSGKVIRRPVVISSHGIRHKTISTQNSGALNRFISRLEYRLDLFCVKKANGLLVANPYIEKYYRKLVPMVSSNIKFIPIPIRIRKYRFRVEDRLSIRQEFGIDNSQVVVGYIGRLAGVKNIVSLLNAFSEALFRLPNLFLLVVGEGILESELKAFVVSKGFSNKVIFTGLRYDVDKIISAIDIFVLPSFSEGLSTSLLEAMASGRAIICSNIPANTQLITNSEDGIIIDPHRVQQITDAILLLGGNESLRIKLGERAREKADGYDESNVFPMIEEYYRTVIESFENK